MQSQSSRNLKDKIIVYIGGFCMALFVALSWFPRDCPVVRAKLIGCPSGPSHFISDEEKETTRLPHQAISSSQTTVIAKATEDLSQVKIAFYYRNDAATKAHLSLLTSGIPEELALISSPALNMMDWPKTTDPTTNLTLYRKNGGESSIREFLTSKPLPTELAVDSTAAARLNLKQSEYSELGDTLNPETTSLITTFREGPADGTWQLFEQTFSLENAKIDADGNLTLNIWFEDMPTTEKPFRLGEVHLDFRKRS